MKAAKSALGTAKRRREPSILGNAILAALEPTALLAIFNEPQLEQVAQEVETTILKIMSEAAG